MRLFEPITIRGMTLKNRIVFPPMGNGRGLLGQRSRSYYVERARGGAGAIFTTGVLVDLFASDESWGKPGGVAEFIENVRSLPDMVHKAGAKIGVQLVHLNRLSFGLSPGGARGQPIAPSARVEPNPTSLFLDPEEEMLRELTVAEIETIVAKFGRAASRVREAGFDFVEFHSAHGYLACQFLSPFYNHRKDEYGGDLAGRMRFVLECVTAMRQAVGDDYPLFCRLGAEEKRPGGITLAGSIECARQLEKAGIDVIDVSTADRTPSPNPDSYYPMGTYIHLAEAIKQKVHIPVIGVGRINTPEVAEAALQKSKVDLVAIGRQLIADPFWPEKVVMGREDEIAPCLSCNRCIQVVLLGGELRCTVNASAVREEQYRITPAEKPKRVLVVGGGPGGMEAAMVAAMRGHEVTLSEKKDRLGGQLLLAAAVPNKDPIGKLADYLASQLVKSGVRVRLNDEVTAKSVEESEPDVVILATGVTPFIPEISGADGDNVVLAEDVLCNRREVGQRIVILGGEQVGCDTAEFLAEKGKKVVLLRRGPTIAASIMPVLRQPILDRLAAKGVTMLTGLRYEQITPTGLEIITSDGREQTIEADTIVIATGGNANTELAQQLERKVPALHLVGDCVQPRDIMGAIADGARVGREI